MSPRTPPDGDQAPDAPPPADPNAPPANPADAALAEALATREQPTGLNAAVEMIRAKLDEEAHVLWTANGPRRSHIESFGGVLAQVDGVRKILIVQVMASGAFKVWCEVDGKTGADQVAHLTESKQAELGI